MFPNFEEILTELSYRIPEGVVDLRNPSHITELANILREFGISDAYELAESAGLVFEQLVEDVMVQNKNSGKVYSVKNFNPDNHVKVDTNTAHTSDKSKTPAANPPKGDANVDSTHNSGDTIINGKDKSLESKDPLSTSVYTSELSPDDTDFDAKNKKFANPIPPPPFKFPKSISSNPKYPKKYIKLLERMMNTQQIGDAKKISHYCDMKAGQGAISAQAGELMTMMAVTMDDKEFAEFKKSISTHIDSLTKPKRVVSDTSRIITKKWLTAAEGNRKGILKRIAKQYPGYHIVASAWDTKSDVEALGMKDYSNKGGTTDVYLRLENDKGEAKLDELSLKQSLIANLLNSGVGKFDEWMGKNGVPDSINQHVYAQNQRSVLSKFCKDNIENIKKLVNSDDELRRVMEAKHLDFETALNDTLNGKGNRHKSKVLIEAVAALQRNGDKSATKLISDMDAAHSKFVSNCITAITTDEKLKEGMLNEIKSEFPLKSVADSEESVVFGEYVLDKSTMKQIFGTSDFNQFKQGLVSEPGPPPYIAYKVKTGGRIIPIANIAVREDGRNYGGIFKFEMTLNKELANEIIKANKEVYG